MHAKRNARLKLGFSVGFVLFGLALGYAGAVPPKRPAGPRKQPKQPKQVRQSKQSSQFKEVKDGLVFPPHQAVLLSGNFDVIFQAGGKSDKAALEINGKPYEWESFEPPVHVAHVRLPPGLHQLRIGKKVREFVVAMNEEEHDGPQAWPYFGFHRIKSDDQRCGHCHQTAQKNGRVALGELKSQKACFECHPFEELDAVQSHSSEPIEDCQACHALHGSSRKGLLKVPSESSAPIATTHESS